MSAVLALPQVKDFLKTLAKGKEKGQDQGKEHDVNAHAVTDEGKPSKKPWDEDIPKLSSPSYSPPTSFSYSSDSSSSSNSRRRTNTPSSNMNFKYRFGPALLSGIVLMLSSITYWMKLISYAHVNHDLRALALESEKTNTQLDYPKNTTLKNLAYFMVAPTLCYQVSYPCTNKIRKGWVFRQVVKLLIFTGLMGFITEQYINPTIQNSQHPLKGNYLYAVERVLKLSIPTLYVWLCIFYCMFHLWLNIIAELTYFGDREFYKDWWNAKTIEEYWKSWNMPVHKWMVRHVYFPCLCKGISKDGAVFISFIISGVFHELCIGIPCHMFRCWAFLGIMFQVPLMILTKYLYQRFQSTMVGNIIFWFFFCIVGQPISVLLYYHDYINQSSTF
ncbi:hypothetical protein L7F22_048701 [Adiantum nelumboides]|nr:hypothetical protein [Adiantum nelumboides]